MECANRASAGYILGVLLRWIRSSLSATVSSVGYVALYVPSTSKPRVLFLFSAITSRHSDHRISSHSKATSTTPEQFVIVILNFANSSGSITLPFPKAGRWKETIDDENRTLTLQVPSDGAIISTDVPSHYSRTFVWPAWSLRQGFNVGELLGKDP